MARILPPSLRPEVATPLLAAAQRIAEVAPWEFMSDLETIAARDDATGQLYVASILGTLGTMFAVVIYRNDAGLRCIQKILTDRRPPDPQSAFEEMDYLKVEWCRKSELQKSDLQTLAAAQFKPQGKGPVWPRFETSHPGWYPWGLTESEAYLMTGLLEKIARFIYLRESSGPLHEEPLAAEVPVIPTGDPHSLTEQQIEWLPLVPPPEQLPDPIVISAEERARLKELPVRKDFIAEMIAPLVPELSFLDENAGRPCIARAGFVVDRRTELVLCARVAHGARPLAETAGPALVQALSKARSRPTAIRVDDKRLAAALRPACEAIAVPVAVAPLEVAHGAWNQFESYLSTQRR